jgi:hypothetical protein
MSHPVSLGYALEVCLEMWCRRLKIILGVDF